jgi:hypothetical protein
MRKKMPHEILNAFEHHIGKKQMVAEEICQKEEKGYKGEKPIRSKSSRHLEIVILEK